MLVTDRLALVLVRGYLGIRQHIGRPGRGKAIGDRTGCGGRGWARQSVTKPVAVTNMMPDCLAPTMMVGGGRGGARQSVTRPVAVTNMMPDCLAPTMMVGGGWGGARQSVTELVAAADMMPDCLAPTMMVG